MEKIQKIRKNRNIIHGRRVYVCNVCVKGLYKLYDKTGKIVYIGISMNNVLQRICDHYREGFKEFESFSIKSFENFTKYELENLERKLIYRYKPIYNIDHNK
jgi:excinuclease UvrABC nuclease subunit